MEDFQELLNSFTKLFSIPDDELTDPVLQQILAKIDAQLSPQVINAAISQTIEGFEQQGLTKAEANEAAESMIKVMNDIIYGDEVYTGNKKILVDTVMNKVYDLFKQSVQKYHSYNIELPMVLAPGAKAPTYAHETDAAADLYTLERTNIPAHSYGNLIRTGVRMQLPEGWLALVLPRSGMSMKTPFRVSNAPGLIDSGYRGEIGVLIDNTSDADTYIEEGTRIAQLLVMPSYRFQPKIVDILADSDRGETGFGASGNN